MDAGQVSSFFLLYFVAMNFLVFLLLAYAKRRFHSFGLWITNSTLMQAGLLMGWIIGPILAVVAVVTFPAFLPWLTRRGGIAMMRLAWRGLRRLPVAVLGKAALALLSQCGLTIVVER